MYDVSSLCRVEGQTQGSRTLVVDGGPIEDEDSLCLIRSSYYSSGDLFDAGGHLTERANDKEPAQLQASCAPLLSFP